MNRRLHPLAWLLLVSLLLPSLLHAEDPATVLPPVELEYSGYKFGQSPAANMVCSNGYCKSQAPGGDGLITFPFSTYVTPGAVSTLAGLAITNSRYTFWEERLYRVSFQVDCTPQEPEECLADIIKGLDREYGLIPLSSSTIDQHALNRRSIHKDFLTDSGALVRVRANRNADGWLMPNVDIVDKGAADRVGSTLSPKFTPKKIPLPADYGRR